MAHSNLMAACALLATSLGGLQASADVGDACGQAIPLAPTCPTVQTILVPEIVYETRTVTTVCQRPEARERTVVVNRAVSQMQDVPCEYTVEVPRTRVRQVTDTVDRPVAHAFVMRTTVDVPHTEARVATRMVSRLVPVQEQRTVCEVTGHWEPQTRSVAYSPLGNGIQAAINAPSPNSAPPEPPAPSNQTFQPPSNRPNPPDVQPPPATASCPSCAAESPCGSSCASCAWVPQTIQRTVNVTCLKPVCQQQTVSYPVTLFQPETQERNVQFVTYQPEQVTRDEEYTEVVPERRVKIEHVPVTRIVPTQQQERYTVMVPYQEQHQVRVPVCHWVAKPVAVPPCASGSCL